MQSVRPTLDCASNVVFTEDELNDSTAILHSKRKFVAKAINAPRLVIDLVPVSSDAKRTYRVWIDPGTNEIRRVDFDQLADSGDVLRGGTSTQTFEYLDDVPLPVHSHFDGNAALNNKMVRIVADRGGCSAGSGDRIRVGERCSVIRAAAAVVVGAAAGAGSIAR